MLRKGVNSAARVVAPSNFVVENVKKHFSVDALLLPPAVDTKQFTLCAEKDLHNPCILYTSSLHDPRKGFISLVKAFEKLLDHLPTARLQLSGHIHPKAIELVFQSVTTKARRAIEILGVGRCEDLPDLYRQAAVTVLPSINEAFGMVLLESLASGTPIVGTNSGGIPDIFSKEGIGTLFEPGGRPEELCKAILRSLELAQDATVWKNCRNHADSFSWDKIGPRFEQIYEELLDGKNVKKISIPSEKEEVLKEATTEYNMHMGWSKFRLNRVFDDALDEMEIDYDTYHKVDLYKPFSTYILGWLLKKGIREGNVLVIGSFTLPLTILFKKMGFGVEGIGMAQKREPWKDIQNPKRITDIGELINLSGHYDVIVCDDLLKHMEDPDGILRVFREKLNNEGTLILTTRNISDGKVDRRFSIGKNYISKPIKRRSDGPITDGDQKRFVSNRVYNLKGIEKLITDAGFSRNESNYIIKEKAVESSLFPIPIRSYFSKSLYYFVQKTFPLRRSHIFIAASKISVL
jgi:hypothetical protein